MKNRILRRLSAVLCALVLLPFSVTPLSAESGPSRQMENYTGAGTVIAVIDAGFQTDNRAFETNPQNPALTKKDVARALGSAYTAGYVSEKIPFSLDYATHWEIPAEEAEALDTDVSHISELGTTAAALAAGCYKGEGDIENEDGTVTHDADFMGAAPDAQLLLMKAARDLTSDLIPGAVVNAIDDAVRLGADVILLNGRDLPMAESVLSAIRHAKEEGIPVLLGAGDVSADMQKLTKNLPASVPDRGTLSAMAGADGAYLIGAAADPYGHITSFTLGETEILYSDSSLLYIGKTFGRLFAGQTVSAVPVPGVGAPADYEGLNVEGKIAVVRRGDITFAEKANAAAAAGAAALIVADNGGGIVQMALEGVEIPAVMVSEKDGDVLLAGDSVKEITLPDAMPGAASFSGRGLAASFTKAVTFLCPGENVLCPDGENGFIYRSGTHLAAAQAAGLCARAVQYMRAAGIRSLSPVTLLSAAACPILGEDGNPLDTRIQGAGLVTGAESFPGAVSADPDGAAVSVSSPLPGENRCTVSFTVTNTGKTAVRCTLTGSWFTTDTVDENGNLTGESTPVPGVTVKLSGSESGMFTVPPGRTVQGAVQITLPEETAEALRKNAVYGYYLDGSFTMTAQSANTEEEPVTVSRPAVLFWGDPHAAPLADASVYDETEAVIAPAYLAVLNTKNGTSQKIGITDITADPVTWDETYNIVSPVILREGFLEVGICALRDLDSAAIRMLDEEGHVLTERVVQHIPRYIQTGKHAVIPVWDFAAPDDSTVLFPDGIYTCEIRLTADGGESVQYMGFFVRADSTRPVIEEIRAEKDGEDAFTLTVTASDNTSLRSVRIYDLSRQYENAFLTGTSDSCTARISGYDGESPLYIEITDAAGSYRTARLTKAQLAELLAGTP